MTDKKKDGETSRLNAEQHMALTIPGFGVQFGSRFLPDNLKYHPVPPGYKALKDPPLWRIQMKFAAPAPTITFGLDIYGDTILGRGVSGPSAPHIDLTNLKAETLGVSRQHALLRPTRNRLFLIDLESTNGSFVNAIPVGKGMAQMLKTADTVALGGLTFVVEVVKAPEKPDPEKNSSSPQRSRKKGSKPLTLTTEED